MKKLFKLLKKDERGLTLVELLAVIVILAIVGAIAFVAIGNVIENSKQDAHIANAQQLISAAKLAEAGGLQIDSTNGVKATDIENIESLTDPWTKDPYSTVGTVYKDGDTYSVALKDNGNKCNLTKDKATEANLNKHGRKLCDTNFNPSAD